ncbi:MAG: hypothetical protein HY908_06870 [Myxococcales bacterium]|nr:hypothetical protein [Myxococcales bacterium]
MTHATPSHDASRSDMRHAAQPPGWGQPPGGGGFGPPPGGGGYGPPPGGGGGWGPPGGGGFGPPPGGGGYGQPPGGGGYGQPPGGYAQAPAGYAQPQAPVGNPPGFANGVFVGVPVQQPFGAVALVPPTRRNAWVAYLLPNTLQLLAVVLAIMGLVAQSVLILGIAAALFVGGWIVELVWYYQMGADLVRVTESREFSAFFALVPGLSRWFRWEAVPDAVESAKRRVGAIARRRHRFAYFFALAWALATDLNEIADALEGVHPPRGPEAHPPPAPFGMPGWY